MADDNSHAAAMNDAGAAAAGSPQKRFRHFWEGPNPVAAQGNAEEEKQGSPIARLYQHALESMFGFLVLGDLSRAMGVSHSWSKAVLAMPCARFVIHCTVARLVPLCSSALSKHVTSFAEVNFDKSQLQCDSLYIAALRMPQLIVLKCILLPSEATKVILPCRLETLELDLSDLTDAAINAALKGISQLTALSSLTLVLPSFLPRSASLRWPQWSRCKS